MKCHLCPDTWTSNKTKDKSISTLYTLTTLSTIVVESSNKLYKL